jgi:hypothetical protein
MLLTPFCLIKMKANINLVGVHHQLNPNRLPMDGVLKAVGSFLAKREIERLCTKLDLMKMLHKFP